MLCNGYYFGKNILPSDHAYVWIPIDDLVLSENKLIPWMIVQYHDVCVLGNRKMPVGVFLYEFLEEAVGVGPG